MEHVTGVGRCVKVRGLRRSKSDHVRAGLHVGVKPELFVVLLFQAVAQRSQRSHNPDAVSNVGCSADIYLRGQEDRR